MPHTIRECSAYQASRAEYAYYARPATRTRILNGLRAVFRWRPLESALRRWTEGRAPTTVAARLVPPEYTYPAGSWRTVVREGLVFQLDLSQSIDHDAYFDFADAALARLLERVEREHTVVDVGANVGIVTTAFARAAPNGRVISLEPDPTTFSRLLAHIERNKLANVTCVNAGVGSAKLKARLYRVLETNSGMNRILPGGDSDPPYPFSEVPLTPLCPVLKALGVEHVDCIKIDVEGYEVEVLEGCREIIERDHPLLFIEVDDVNLREQGRSAAELLSVVAAMNYSIRRAATGDVVSVLSTLDGCHFDALCEWPHSR